MLAFILGLIAGAASPTQASVNGRVREDVKSTYITSIISFTVSFTLMAVIRLAAEHSVYIPFREIASYPVWIWFGGVCGMIIVTLNVVCLEPLGSARNVMLICFGQIMAGLIIDHFGLFYSPRVSMSLMRGIGAILSIIGIALVNGIVRTGGDDAEASVSGKKKGASIIIYVLLATFNGFACSSQIAFNGALKTVTESSMMTTMISMMVGLICALATAGVITLVKGRHGIYDYGDPAEARGIKPWMVTGGFLAALIVIGNAVAAPVLGTGVVTMLNLVGMMGAGLLIDAAGFLGIEKKPVTLAKIAGMLLMLAGSAMITFM